MANGFGSPDGNLGASATSGYCATTGGAWGGIDLFAADCGVVARARFAIIMEGP